MGCRDAALLVERRRCYSPVWRGIFCLSQLSVQTVSVHPRVQITCINICGHVKDPVVHVSVRCILETRKHIACTVGWTAPLCRIWLSPGKAARISCRKTPLRRYNCIRLMRTYVSAFRLLPSFLQVPLATIRDGGDASYA